MSNNFRKDYPDFASIERQIRRAQAERAAVLGTWIAEAIVHAARTVRGLFGRSTPAPARRPGRLLVRTSVPR
jgi:hypothetical protein